MYKPLPAKTPTPVRQSSAQRKSANTSPVRAPKPNTMRTPSNPKLRFDLADSKVSARERSFKREPSPQQSFRKLSPRTLADTLGCPNLISDYSLDFGNTHAMGKNNLPKETTQESTQEEYIDEVASLKKELAAKDATIEKLKSENLGLRREIQEFVTVADKIHNNLDEELRQYEKKMATLEQENRDLMAENRFYKEQAQRKFQPRSSLDKIPLESLVLNSINDPSESRPERVRSQGEGSYFQVKDILTTLNTAKNLLPTSIKEVRTEASPQKDRSPQTCRITKEEEKAVKVAVPTKTDGERNSVSPVRKTRNSVHLTRFSSNVLAKVPGRVLERKNSTELVSEKRTSISQLKL